MEEIVTITSEDVGFKALGSKVILPAFTDEKLPLASLNNFQISNDLNLFVATCGGESHQLIVGNLQELRDYVVSEEEGVTVPANFTVIDDIQDDIISVNILPNIEKIVIVTLHGQLIYIDPKNTASKQTKQINENITLLKTLMINHTLFYIDMTHTLYSFNLSQDTNRLLLNENVSDFDKCMNGDKLVVLTKNDNKLQFYTIEKDTLNLEYEFPHPDDIVSTIEDEEACVPLTVTALYNNQYLMTFGNSPSEDEEDIMYDHKTYIMKLDGNNSATYYESFDIAPSFGSVKRLPSIYSIVLPNIVDGVPNYNIIASSCSTEVSIWNSREIVQPDQDGERAVLPVSQETDNDTCPIGMDLDYSTTGVISEPCSGVDKIDKLPLIYLLNNEGLLQIWGFYHSHAIKTNAFRIHNLADFFSNGTAAATSTYSANDDVHTLTSTQTDQSSVFTKNDDQATLPTTNEAKPTEEVTLAEDDVSSSLGGLSFGQSNNNETSKPAFSFGSSGFGTSTESPFNFSENKTTAAPTFGSTGLGQSPNTTTPVFASSAFGKPSFGQTESVNTMSTSGQSAFGKPAFGQSSFGQTSDSNISTEAPKTAFGQTSFGQSSFGQNNGTSQTSSFGKPSFGKTSFGQNDDSHATSPFGKPAFGQTSFGATKELSSEKLSSTTPAFGAFSNLNKGESPFAVSEKDQSPFANLKKGASPFANLEIGESPSANLKKGESPFQKLETIPANTVDDELDFRQDDKNINEQEVEQEEDIRDSEEEEEDEEEENESLSDTTVEQTPFSSTDDKTNNKFSISNFTDSLKKTASISTSNLASISTSNFANSAFGDINKTEKSSSPFASFANNLTKSETPSFSLSSLNIEKDADSVSREEISEKGVPQEDEQDKNNQEDTTEYLEEEKTKAPEVETERQEIDAEEQVSESEREPENQTEEQGEKISDSETEEPKRFIETTQQEETTLETPMKSFSGFESSDERESAGSEGQESEGSEEQESETESVEYHDESPVEVNLDDIQSIDDDIETSKSESVDAAIKTASQKIQTEPVEYISTGVQAKELRSQASQSKPIKYSTFQMQSFENDENYLAEVLKPKPLGKYYTNAQISDIPYSTNDKTMRLFESTYQQIEAEFMVLEDNIQMIKEFFEDQTTIDLERRTEKSLGNKYTWRIPEVKQLFDIVQKRQVTINNFSEEIDELNTKISDYKKDDLTALLSEKNTTKEHYAELEYLRTESLNNKLAPLSSHQNEMKKLLRHKMSSLDKKSDEIKQCLFVSKSLVNYLKDPVNTDVDFLLRSAEYFDASNKMKPKSITLGSSKLVTQKQIDSFDVVQAGLNINAKKQVGEFFKQINSKKF